MYERMKTAFHWFRKVGKNMTVREMNRIDEIIYKEKQKAAYEEQREEGFLHEEQPKEDCFEEELYVK